MHPGAQFPLWQEPSQHLSPVVQYQLSWQLTPSVLRVHDWFSVVVEPIQAPLEQVYVVAVRDWFPHSPQVSPKPPQLLQPP